VPFGGEKTPIVVIQLHDARERQLPCSVETLFLKSGSRVFRTRSSPICGRRVSARQRAEALVNGLLIKWLPQTAALKNAA
jgi:hypothetical protein